MNTSLYKKSILNAFKSPSYNNFIGFNKLMRFNKKFSTTQTNPLNKLDDINPKKKLF